MNWISVLYDYQYKDEIAVFEKQNQSVEIEFVGLTAEEDEKELKSYIDNSENEYIYIYADGYVYGSELIASLKESLDLFEDTAIAMTAHRFADENYHLIAPPYRAFEQGLYDKIYEGDDIWNCYRREHINIIGDIGCCLFRKKLLNKLTGEEIKILVTEQEWGKKNKILEKLFHGVKARYIERILAARVGKTAPKEQLQTEYDNWFFTKNKALLTKKSIKKEITFFYTDKGEYYNVLPIAEEAERRGYKVLFTTELLRKAEIGVYSQHVCYPENSAFSVVLLHDMLQDYCHWPNLWELEPWNEFDIGILPGKQWVERWRECGGLYYANPKLGVYCLGYPKKERLTTTVHQQKVKELKKTLCLKYDYSILYAPSWENDNKEEDFVQALKDLPVNLLVKQAHWNKEYEFVIDNIKRMRKMHEGKYENLYYINPEEDILTVLDVCDIVISDESNVLLEALLFDKTGVSVRDWLIPDCDPPRFSAFPEGYAVFCNKAELRECVKKIQSGILDKRLIGAADDIFGESYTASNDIMNIIDFYLGFDPNVKVKNRLLPRVRPFD